MLILKKKFHIAKEMTMENEKCCSGMCCALTFLAGAVIGGGIALLLAPQSGERTRRQLKRMAEEAEEKIEDCYDEIKERAAEMIEKV